jgi:hypothetical protein
MGSKNYKLCSHRFNYFNSSVSSSILVISILSSSHIVHFIRSHTKLGTKIHKTISGVNVFSTPNTAKELYIPIIGVKYRLVSNTADKKIIRIVFIFLKFKLQFCTSI